MKEKLIGLALNMLPFMIEKLTPTIKDMLHSFIDEWEVKAKETDNEFDDMAVAFIKAILDY